MKSKTKVQFAALCTVPFIMVLGNSMLIPVLPTMKAVMNLSQFQTGLIITAFSIPAGAVIGLAGFLADRYGRKLVMVPSLILYGLGGLLAGLAALLLKSPYWVVLAGRVLQGIGAAGTAPIAMALAGDVFKSEERSKALGLLEASNGFGKVVSPILGSLAALLSWHAPFFVFVALAVPSAAAVWLLVKEPKAKGKKPGVRKYFRTLAQIFAAKGRSLIPSFFAGMVALFTLFGVLFYLSDTLEKQYRIDGLVKGFIIAVPVLLMSITSYLVGIYLQKQKPAVHKAFVVAGLMLTSATLAVFAFWRHPWVLYGVVSIIGVGTGFVLPSLNTLITSSCDLEQRGMVTSGYGAVRFIGVALGPPLFGLLMGCSNLAMFLAAAGIALFAAVLSLILINAAQLMTTDTGEPQIG